MKGGAWVGGIFRFDAPYPRFPKISRKLWEKELGPSSSQFCWSDMKLPATSPPSTEFKNAEGSTVPKQFALEARKNPEVIKEMVETESEKIQLEKEALARQYCILIDRSGSMSWDDPTTSTSRWESARKAVEKIVEKCFVYDCDHKVPVFLFDNDVDFVGECTDSQQVMSIFKSYKPRGSTDLAKGLNALLEEYAGRQRPNYEVCPGLTVVVILDGMADDKEAVKDVMRKYSDPANGYCSNHTQIAISFLQIANDPGATAFLKELDEGVLGKPDICDTKHASFLDEQGGGVDRLLYDAIFD